MTDKLSERIRQFTFNLSELHGSKADAQRFFRGWHDEVAALEARLSKMEKAAQPFVTARFKDGIAGHDNDGHPLSHEGMARKHLQETLAGERDDE